MSELAPEGKGNVQDDCCCFSHTGQEHALAPLSGLLWLCVFILVPTAHITNSWPSCRVM